MAGREIAFTGYHQPECAEADLVYWAKMPKWDSDVAAAVLLGFNPDAFYGSGSLRYSLRHGAGEKYWSLRKLTASAVSSKRLKIDDAPEVWLDWAQRYEIPVPPLLIQEVPKWAERHNAATEERAAQAQPSETIERIAPVSDVPTRERESMLKIIIGMAVSGYKYDPKALRSGVIKKIENDLANAGVSLSHDTIRGYLREGAELLPPKDD